MRNEDWIRMFGMIPEDQQDQLVISLKNGSEVVVETLFRCEETFVVVRGRQAGNTDDGRLFFVPYDNMICTRLDRTVKLQEIYALYGEEPPESAIEDRLGAEAEGTAPAPKPVAAPATRPASPNAPATMVAGGNGAAPAPEPTATGRNNLLERIRAARATNVANTRQQTH